MRRSTALRLLLRSALVGGAYVGGAQLGLPLALENRNVTAVWPSTGIAVAALLVWGLNMWPGVTLGAFVANLLNGASPATAAAISVGNTIAPLIAAIMLTQVFRFRTTLERVGDVAALFGLAGFGAMAVSATAGTGALALTGALGDSSAVSVWSVWWIGDALGVGVFAPFLVLVAKVDRSSPVVRRPLEWVALVLTTAGATYALFNVRLALVFLLFVPVVWASLRFHQVGAASVTVIVAVIAIVETVTGHGPFAFLSPTENLVSLQIFNGATAFLSLVLATVMAGRERVEQRLRSSEERYRKLFDEARDVVCIYDSEGRLTYANDAAARLTGLSRQRLETMSITDLVAPEDIRIVRRTNERLRTGQTESATYEIAILSTGGRRVALEVATTAVREDGTVTGIQSIGRDVTSRKVAEDQLRQQVLYDPLTNLSNRTLLQERLAYAISLARKNGTSVALVLLDLDGFKAVNDAHDTRTGDRLLVMVGDRLCESFRDPDTVARVAEDEFAVLFASLDPERSAMVLGEQLLAEFQAPFHLDEQSFDLSASIGIAIYPNHGGDAAALLQRADLAMFAAKRRGGACYDVYQAELDSVGARRLALVDELVGAIDSDRLVLHYQPKIEISSMRTVGVEALVRWRHPQLGLLPPVEFVPLAETSGTIAALTWWVLERSLRQIAVWKDAGRDMTISVNVSAGALREADLIDRLQEPLETIGVGPERLLLEVTEATVMDEALHATLQRAGQLGVRISVDDFGTGSSSMVHLRKLPIAEIKLDRSFVIGMVGSKEEREIARSIIDLGHNLGVVVVAEGVETRETWNTLATLGCDQAQGFLICPPSPPAEIESWFLTPAWSGRVR